MFQTLFTMNNETVAVWSHVAGLALTWLLRSHHRALPVRCGWERVVLEGYFASCAFLYLASAAYHCLKHHRSFAVYDAALAADLSGIVVVFATCASLLTATALHHASWLLAPALLLILWPSASALHRIWTTRDRASTVPTAHTAALFATGTIILTAAFLLGGQSRLATRLLHCILAFGVGALFYVSRVPERIFVRVQRRHPPTHPRAVSHRLPSPAARRVRYSGLITPAMYAPSPSAPPPPPGTPLTARVVRGPQGISASCLADGASMDCACRLWPPSCPTAPTQGRGPM